MIERTRSLELLSFVDHHETPSNLNLPTWVPDWHGPNSVAPLRSPTWAAGETSDSISFAESDKGTILKCRGIFIDTLRVMSDMMDPNEFTVTTFDREIQKKIPFLYDHLWSKFIAAPEMPPLVRDFIDSCSLVLTGGLLNELDSTSGERREQQVSDLAALILKYEHLKLPTYLNGFFPLLSPEDKVLVHTVAARGSAIPFVQEMTWTSMCRRTF